MTRPATTTATADIAALGAAYEDETLTIDFIPAVEPLDATFGTYGSLWTIDVNFGETYILIDANSGEWDGPYHTDAGLYAKNLLDDYPIFEPLAGFNMRNEFRCAGVAAAWKDEPPCVGPPPALAPVPCLPVPPCIPTPPATACPFVPFIGPPAVNLPRHPLRGRQRYPRFPTQFNPNNLGHASCNCEVLLEDDTCVCSCIRLEQPTPTSPPIPVFDLCHYPAGVNGACAGNGLMDRGDPPPTYPPGVAPDCTTKYWY